MLKTVEKFIAKNNLLAPHSKVIVGLSGGKDSMVLLDVLTLLDYQCIVAHCNFHLRGNESNRDAHFVKKWCKSMDIPLEMIDFDTSTYAKDKKISIEMAARELRYDWFEILRRQHEAQAVAVAHHIDDSIETMLLNLIRGTGIKGLTGISPKNENILRPLLCVSRKDIEKYIEEREFSFVEDSTNTDEKYKRNAVRNTLIPMMEKLNPSVREALERTINNLEEVEKVYDKAIEKSIEKVFSDNKIDINKLVEEPSSLSVLFAILTKYGFTSSDISDINNSLTNISGKIFLSDNYKVIKDRDFLLIEKKEIKANSLEDIYIYNETQRIEYPISLEIEFIEEDTHLIKSPNILMADADKITFPLKLRRWRNGDWFIPLGMKGRKKMSDYFVDKKLSLSEKENVWILTTDKEEIVWIVGKNVDERFKITNKTTKTLKIQYFPEN